MKMEEYVDAFPRHLKEAVEIANGVSFTLKSPVSNVLITGLGGSGIGGTIVAQVVEKHCSVPVCVNKDYFIPNYINEKSLVIASSYSGNTEETISAMELAIEKKAQVALVCSGGAMLDFAKNNRLNYIQIPPGIPPRAAFGYSFTQLFAVLQQYGLLSIDFVSAITPIAEALVNDKVAIKAEASKLAQKLNGKIPVLYASANLEGVLIRFRQQINENSKMLCWHHVFPELNHNELVGWRDQNDQFAVVVLKTKNDYYRTTKRMEITLDVLKKYTSNIFEIHSNGESLLFDTLYLIHLTDWVSVFLADENKVDAVEVNIITHLKSELGKI